MVHKKTAMLFFMQMVYVFSLRSMEKHRLTVIEIGNSHKSYFHLLKDEILNKGYQKIKTDWEKDWYKIDIVDNMDVSVTTDTLEYFNSSTIEQLQAFMNNAFTKFKFRSNILVDILVSLDRKWSHPKNQKHNFNFAPCLERVKLISENITLKQDVGIYQQKIEEQKQTIKKKQDLCDQNGRYLQYLGGYGIVMTIAFLCTLMFFFILNLIFKNISFFVYNSLFSFISKSFFNFSWREVRNSFFF